MLARLATEVAATLARSSCGDPLEPLQSGFATRRPRFQPPAEPDLQIASIALQHGLPLATHNAGHFDRIPELALVDWLACQRALPQMW